MSSSGARVCTDKVLSISVATCSHKWSTIWPAATTRSPSPTLSRSWDQKQQFRSCSELQAITGLNFVITLRALRGFIKTIPQPPGNIVGTVNDAYVPPPPHKLHGSLHWTSERVVAIGLAPFIMTPFVTGTSYPLVDSIMGTLLLYHCYVGFESCIIDYIPLRVYGIWHKAAIGLLGFGTLVAGYGVYIIETTEKEGLVGVVKKLWKA
ncbi:hypothetical protein KL907_003330 [Ogataea polymorpha]|nr:hypothetical protein KL907_003330 [Ogataea polymorpha]